MDRRYGYGLCLGTRVNTPFLYTLSSIATLVGWSIFVTTFPLVLNQVCFHSCIVQNMSYLRETNELLLTNIHTKSSNTLYTRVSLVQQTFEVLSLEHSGQNWCETSAEIKDHDLPIHSSAKVE